MRPRTKLELGIALGMPASVSVAVGQAPHDVTVRDGFQGIW
jgi:hypothetical protein